MNLIEHLRNDCLKHAKKLSFNLYHEDGNGVPGVSGEVSKGKKFETFLGEGLKQDGYVFERAGSQKPYDFRNITHPDFPEEIIPNFEIKKSTTGNIMCNDTIPTNEAYYFIVLFPRKKNIQHIKPLFSKGGHLNCEKIESSCDDKIQEFIYRVKEIVKKFREELKIEIDNLKKEFNMGDVLRVYLRPSYSLNISKIIDRFEQLA